VALSSFVKPYEQLILDLDGCVWIGDDAIPGSVEAVEALRAGGKGVAFVTNNARHSTEDVVQKLWGLGVQASLADVVTVGGAMQHLLAETRRGMTAFVIGTEAMIKHVTDAGLRVLNDTDLASRAELVIVSATSVVDYDDIRNATLALHRGADFIASSRDPTYPMPEGPWPGAGAILAAVETATGRTAPIVGKPEPQLMLTAIDRLGDGSTLVVGDRIDTDVVAAHAAHLESALVLSGGTTAEEAEEWKGPRPKRIAKDLRELVLA
jgi:HAD superfamily hydrolase (TIGR01450 family)